VSFSNIWDVIFKEENAMQLKDTLYPPLEPHYTGMLEVDEIHTLYWEECGNPDGVPVVFLHGGPGGGASIGHRRLFDPQFYRIIIFDQRGAGRSRPRGELKNNSPMHLVADMEKLREHLDIKQWLVFGGSWGSTLAILYGETYPERCLGFVLRGIFLMRPLEIEWFLYGMRHLLPETWERFSTYIPEEERKDLLKAYHTRLTHPDPAVHMPAARIFSQTEGEMSFLLPNPDMMRDIYLEDTHALGLARIEADYFVNYADKMLGDKLLHNISKINYLPAFIIQGRYDLCCPPVTAYELSKAWPKAEFIIVPDGGHAASEPGISKELIKATEKFKYLCVLK
jgi:proline iminopeptidase